MGALVVKVRHVFVECMSEGVLTKQDQPRQRFLFDRPHPALGVGIQIGRPRRERHALHPCRIDRPLKRWTILAVAVVDQILPWKQEAPVRHGNIPRGLPYPAPVRVRCHPCYMDLSCAEPDEEEHVIGHQPAPSPYLRGEEISGYEYIHVRADKLVPCGRLLAFGSGWNPMALEDIAYCLGTDGIAKVGQYPNNAVIASGSILLGKANNQLLDLFVNLRPP